VAASKELPQEGVEMSPLIFAEPDTNLCLPARLTPNHNLARTGGNKILVIDDDQILCLGIDTRLKANHYDPCFAHDAESALTTALAEMPDLIILDIGLRGHDGYFVMHSLNAFPELASVPIIVLTGLDAFSHKGRCRDAGAKRFFEKPVTNLRLLTAIRQLVG
jgi:two-component system KDP operon response regulator KdpE